MNILVAGANGQLGNEMRILAKNSADKYVFTDVIEASEESIAMLKKLAGNDINTDTEHLDITKLDAIREVVKHEKIDVILNYTQSGIYHFSNECVYSWFDFTKMIAAFSGYSTCHIQPCYSEYFSSKVKRPAFSVLDKSKIKQTYNITVPYWVDSLHYCMMNFIE